LQLLAQVSTHPCLTISGTPLQLFWQLSKQVCPRASCGVKPNVMLSDKPKIIHRSFQAAFPSNAPGVDRRFMRNHPFGTQYNPSKGFAGAIVRYCGRGGFALLFDRFCSLLFRSAGKGRAASEGPGCGLPTFWHTAPSGTRRRVAAPLLDSVCGQITRHSEKGRVSSLRKDRSRDTPFHAVT